MPTGDEKAFLAAILAEPDDDTPRLVFADWLDERGVGDDGARAEFIRVQCRAATLKPQSRERAGLEKRADEILKVHSDHWKGPLKKASGTPHWVFRRGFIDHLVIPARRFVACAAKLFHLAPTLRSVTFPDASNEVRGLSQCKYLARLRTVVLSEMCSCGHCGIQSEIVELFHSPHVENLRELFISGNRLEAAHLTDMFNNTTVTKLRRLDVSHNPLGAIGVARVARAAALVGLEELDLSGTRPTRTGFGSLANSHFPKLKRLALRGNGIGVAAVRILMKSDLMNQLSELDLSLNRIGDSGGTTVLLEQAGFDSLDVLDLRDNDIGDTFAVKQRFGKRVRV